LLIFHLLTNSNVVSCRKQEGPEINAGVVISRGTPTEKEMDWVVENRSIINERWNAWLSQ
jgi:hypothetical protein